MKSLMINKKKKIIFIFFLIWASTIVYSQTAEINLQKSLSKIIAPKTPGEQKEGIREFKREMINNGFKSFPAVSKVININDKSLNSDEMQVLFSGYDRELIASNFYTAGEFLKKGKFQKFTGLLFDNIFNVAKDPLNSILFIKGIIKVLYNSAFIIIYLMGIIFLVKYARSLQHDFNLKYKHKINKIHVLFLIYVVILCAPLFLTIKILYLPLYWLLLFSPYYSKKELSALFSTGIITILILVLALYAGMVTSGIKTDEFRCYEALSTPFSNYTPEKKGNLQTFTKATIELRGNNYRAAVELFKEVEQSSEFFSLALNNLGVAYFKLQELALARDFFNDALKKMDKSFIPHFNLSMTHLKNFNLAESSNELVTAFDYNSKETLQDMMVNIKQVNPIIATPPIQELTSKLFALKFENDVQFSSLTGFKDLMFLVIILVMIALISLTSQTRNTSKTCGKCGKPFVYLESQNSTLCKQCVTVFVNKDDMDSAKRKEKINKIKHYNSIKQYIEIFFSIAFPGLFDIFLSNSIVVGIFTGFVFFTSLFSIINIYESLHSIFIATPFILTICIVFFVNLINVISWYKEELWH